VTGRSQPTPTVEVCWDADRLHLRRVGATVQTTLLSTVAGRSPAALSQADGRRALPIDWNALSVTPGARPQEYAWSQ
jgi:hypothetical protein